MLFGLGFVASVACAGNLDNAAGRYSFPALPSAASEMRRMNSLMELSDQQPTGRYVRAGETIHVTMAGMPPRYRARAIVNFHPEVSKPWLNQQAIPLRNGDNRFIARRGGPLHITIASPDGMPVSPVEIAISITGGKPLPLFVQGQTSIEDWRRQRVRYADAPFVQLVNQRSMITLPRTVHRQYPIADPSETLATIDRVLAMEDTLAGFDDAKAADMRTPLRTHFLVDFRATQKQKTQMYMYANDQFIAMLADNTTDLTDPARLRTQWAIWHEIGHTRQQRSWTWDTLSDVTVNLFSLYVQEQMGMPGRLDEPDYEGITPRARALAYLSRSARNYVTDAARARDELLYAQLVMFDQLRRAYGWDIFTRLFRYYREHPLPDDATDAQKVDQFVWTMCTLSGNDLRPFFATWGLRASTTASRQIAALQLPVAAIPVWTGAGGGYGQQADCPAVGLTLAQDSPSGACTGLPHAPVEPPPGNSALDLRQTAPSVHTDVHPSGQEPIT